MWKPENRQQFDALVADLMADPEVLALNEMSQHTRNFSRLDHSIHVAYLSFLICRRLKLNYIAAARAGLLHDFHFGTDDDGVKRLWQHPHDALANAERKCNISDLEKDIIVKHMWPLTRPLPRHKESFVVSLADKICATMEFCQLSRMLRVKKHLNPNAA